MDVLCPLGGSVTHLMVFPLAGRVEVGAFRVGSLRFQVVSHSFDFCLTTPCVLTESYYKVNIYYLPKAACVRICKRGKEDHFPLPGKSRSQDCWLLLSDWRGKGKPEAALSWLQRSHPSLMLPHLTFIQFHLVVAIIVFSGLWHRRKRLGYKFLENFGPTQELTGIKGTSSFSCADFPVGHLSPSIFGYLISDSISRFFPDPNTVATAHTDWISSGLSGQGDATWGTVLRILRTVSFLNTLLSWDYTSRTLLTATLPLRWV